MKKIETEEMKLIQLDILNQVANFCENNNIRYCLYGGSMLGAVRHKGYIPWDDDIDIAMPRPDYERFLNEFVSDNLSIMHWTKENKCLCTYAKVYDNRTSLEENMNFGQEYGVNIDVFPIDGLPQDDKKIKKVVKTNKALWGLAVCGMVRDISRRRLSKKIQITLMRVIYKVIPIRHYVTGLSIRKAQKYAFDNSNKVAVLVWGNGIKEVIFHDTATQYQKVDFEQYKFNIPQNYEDYLVSIYGDYMTPPSEAARKLNHNFTAYWKDSSTSLN